MRVPPLIMGHEFSGEVAALGPDVKHAYVGERAAVNPNLPCGRCVECRAGFPNLCSGNSRRIMGVTLAQGNHQGALAEYICVPENRLLPIEESISFEEASMLEPLAVALHGVNHLGDIHGKTVVVFGAGPMGLLSVACAKYKGAASIVAVDLDRRRLQVAERMGATCICGPSVCLRDIVSCLTDGIGADASIDCVGSSESINQQMSIVRPGGKIVLIGMGKGQIDLALKEAIFREVELMGSYTYIHEMSQGIQLLQNHAIDLSPIISNVVGLDECIEEFENLAQKREGRLKVIVNP